MSEQDDEEETTPGRPNAWWQQQRVGFSGDFRGVKEPKPGAQAVTADQIIGDYDTCWCGSPMGHDWPGKANGRKHPKEQQVSAVAVEAEVPHIDPKELRGFCDEYKELILMAVNQYGVRYRMANKRDTIVLFPKDKTVQPFSLANRFNTNTNRRFQRWFARHVVVAEGGALVKDVEIIVDDYEQRSRREEKHVSDQEQEAAQEEDVRRLAEALNSEEHEVRERAKKAAPVAAKKAAKKAVPAPPAYEIPEPKPEVQSTETWVPARRAKDGEIMVGVLTSGRDSYKCSECDYRATKGDRVVSHYKTAHDEAHRASMYGDEARLRKAARLAETNMRKKITPAVEILMEAMGIEVGNTEEVDKLKAELARTSAALEREIAARQKAETERDDAKARLELMREALRA